MMQLRYYNFRLWGQMALTFVFTFMFAFQLTFVLNVTRLKILCLLFHQFQHWVYFVPRNAPPKLNFFSSEQDQEDSTAIYKFPLVWESAPQKEKTNDNAAANWKKTDSPWGPIPIFKSLAEFLCFSGRITRTQWLQFRFRQPQETAGFHCCHLASLRRLSDNWSIQVT